MARNKGYLVPGTVKTLDDKDKYPVADVNDIAGARHIVQSDTARNNIPKLRRKVGMECLVVDTNPLDGSVAFRLYKLKNNPNTETTTANDWEEMADLTAAEIANFITNSNLTTILSNYAQKTDLPNMTDYLKSVDAVATYAKKDEVYSKTDADNTFAKKADLPEFDKTIVDVVTPDVLSVTFNTDITTANVLPTKVDVAYEDGSNGKIDVDWDTTTYDKEKSGLQVLLGTLKNLPTGTKNAIVNVVQHIIVGIDIHIIDEIVSTNPVVLTDLYDTPFDNLELPEKMKVKYTDGTTGFLDIDWSAASSVYDPQELAEQTLVGEFILTEKDKQPAVAYNPSAKVTLFKQKKIVSQAAINDVSVLEETAFADAGFPTKNTVTLDDGSTVDLDIIWNKGSYNPLTVSHQSLTGEYVLPNYITNEDDITPVIAFEVCAKPDICDAEDPTMAPVNMGISINDLANDFLPKSTNVTILPHDYDGVNVLMTQGTANISWDIANAVYDPSTPGDYYITGELAPPAGVTNKTNITVEVKVTVLAATGPTYWVKSVPVIDHAPLPNGSSISDVNAPASIPNVAIACSDGTETTDTVTVVWTADPNFDGSPTINKVYEWTGVITPSNPEYQVNGQTAKMNVPVLAPDVVKYTLESVDPAGSAIVTEGDTFTEASLGLPNQIGVTVKKSDDNTTAPYTADISVWTLSPIDNDGNGVIDNVSANSPITVYGTLVLSSIVIDGKSVENKDGKTAEFVVTVNAKADQPATTHRIIKEVTTTFTPETINYGDNVNDFVAAFQTAHPTVDIVIDDPTNGDTPMNGVSITWAASNGADTTQANSEFQLIGTLANLEGEADPVYDDNGKSPIYVKVTVGPAPVSKTIENYVFKNGTNLLTVENGTAEGDIAFTEDTVVANCLVGSTGETHEFAITAWQAVTAYDGTTAGNYEFTPVFDASSLTNDGYTGTPALPVFTVTVKAAEGTDPTILEPITYIDTVNISPSDETVYLENFNPEVFAKLKEINDKGQGKLEDAYLGIDDGSGNIDLTTRTVELRYLGTPAIPLEAPGLRIPFEDEDDSVKADFQNKLAAKGLDGAFGDIPNPQYLSIINIVSDASNSYLLFGIQVDTARFMWRFSADGSYLTEPGE